MSVRTNSWSLTQYALYDFKRGRLAKTEVFTNKQTADRQASKASNLMAVPLALMAVRGGTPLTISRCAR